MSSLLRVLASKPAGRSSARRGEEQQQHTHYDAAVVVRGGALSSGKRREEEVGLRQRTRREKGCFSCFTALLSTPLIAKKKEFLFLSRSHAAAAGQQHCHHRAGPSRPVSAAHSSGEEDSLLQLHGRERGSGRRSSSSGSRHERASVLARPVVTGLLLLLRRFLLLSLHHLRGGVRRATARGFSGEEVVVFCRAHGRRDILLLRCLTLSTTRQPSLHYQQRRKRQELCSTSQSSSQQQQFLQRAALIKDCCPHGRNSPPAGAAPQHPGAAPRELLTQQGPSWKRRLFLRKPEKSQKRPQ